MGRFQEYMLAAESHGTPIRAHKQYQRALKAVRDLLSSLLKILRTHPDKAFGEEVTQQIAMVRRRITTSLRQGGYQLMPLQFLVARLQARNDPLLLGLVQQLDQASRALKTAHEDFGLQHYSNLAHANEPLVLTTWMPRGTATLYSDLMARQIPLSSTLSLRTRARAEQLLAALREYPSQEPDALRARDDFVTDIRGKLALLDLFHALQKVGCPTTEEILSNPFDQTNWQVSSDWLQEQGHDDLASRIDAFVQEFFIRNPPLLMGQSPVQKHYRWEHK